jgi:hypothetical protein
MIKPHSRTAFLGGLGVTALGSLLLPGCAGRGSNPLPSKGATEFLLAGSKDLSSLRILEKSSRGTVLTNTVNEAGLVSMSVPGKMQFDFNMPLRLGTSWTEVADGVEMRQAPGSVESRWSNGSTSTSIGDFRTTVINGSHRDVLDNKQQLAVIQKLTPKPIGARPPVGVRPMVDPVQGDGGGGFGGGTPYPYCDLNNLTFPCTDSSDGSIIWGQITAVTSVGGGTPWGGFLDTSAGTLIPINFGGIGFVYIDPATSSCYAAATAAALGAVNTMGQTFWNALQRAAGGEFDLTELVGWSAGDLVELAGAAIAALGIGEWIAIVIAALAIAGVAWEVSQCGL